MRHRLVILFTLALLTISSAVSADIIPEGEKSVQYCFQVLNGDRYPDYSFLVYFRGAIESSTVIGSDRCIDYYKLNQPLLYAIKKSDFDEAEIGTDQQARSYFESNPNLIPSDVIIRKVATVNRNNPVRKIVDVLRITGVSQDRLEIEKVKAIYTFDDGTSEEQAYAGEEFRPGHSREYTPAPTWRPPDAGEPAASRWFAALWYVVIPAIALLVILAVLLVRLFKRNRSGQ